MAAALRAAEGGGIFFPNPQGGVFSKFSGQGGYTKCLNVICFTISSQYIITQFSKTKIA